MTSTATLSSPSTPGPADQYPTRGLSPQPPTTQKDQNGSIHPANPSIPPLPIEEDVMQLARLGEIGAIQKLFDSGKCDANFRDEQGITPLHWAAIKNHYALCHFLIQSGADINAAGGDLQGTPVLWAARSCNYYIVNLLLENGADPLRSDSQGYNLLQNATLDGNVFQILLLLQHDIPIDTPDSKGHTALMWAAYKGYPACVELLLQWGASVSATDDEGFTALHWALVKGSYGCIQKLVEYGSDRFVSTSTGKTPAVVAKEMNSRFQWHRALADCGYLSDGNPNVFPLPFIKDRGLFISRFFFLWPFVVIFCSIYIISGMPIFAAVPLTLVAIFSLQWSAIQLLQWAPLNMRKIHHTPYLAGVFAGSLFWVGVQWIVRVLPQTYSTNPFMNISFGVLAVLCAYFYFSTMLQDPGYVPKSVSRSEQKSVAKELIDAGRFDDHNFCVTCMIRKPLRSKHCKRCGRCVAKHDHHCPWVNTCVAINNHRNFIYYIVTMEIGVILFCHLTFTYILSLPKPELTTCNILRDDFCAELNKDPFTIVTAMWIGVNLSWVTMLIVVQLVQVARATTTWEQMNPQSHLSPPAAAVTSALVAGTTSLDDAGLTATRPEAPPADSVPPGAKKDGCLEHWKRLLGVDAFVATAKFGTGAEGRAQQRRNPFTRGCFTNCKDFFCDPSPVFGTRPNGKTLLGGQLVDYTKMFEAPPRMAMLPREGEQDMAYLAVDSEEHV